MGMDQYLSIPFLGEWTSIYQLFWCSPGVQGFDTLPYNCLTEANFGIPISHLSCQRCAADVPQGGAAENQICEDSWGLDDLIFTNGSWSLSKGAWSYPLVN